MFAGNCSRFDFDFTTLTRRKVNDHFEFPLVLDMAPFLEGGPLHKRVLDQARKAMAGEDRKTQEGTEEEVGSYSAWITPISVFLVTASMLR